MRALFRRVLLSRLTHFLVGGSILFGLAGTADSNRVIDFGQPFASDEARARAIEEELLYREAKRLHLEDGDGIVRQRLIQKMLYLAEDLGGASREPTEAELRSYFDQTRDRWMRPEAVAITHVIASTRDAAEALRSQVERWSADPSHDRVPPPVGDSFPLARSVESSVELLAANYGTGFAQGLASLEPKRWSRPVESRWGWHLVRVSERRIAAPAAFEDIRQDLQLEYTAHRREEAVHRLVTSLLPEYRVTANGERIEALPVTRLKAARTASSGED